MVFVAVIVYFYDKNKYMEFSLSSIENNLIGAHECHLAPTDKKKGHESIRERVSRFWDTFSHVLVALLLVVVLAGSLSMFEQALSPSPQALDISKVQQIGRVDVPLWHRVMGIESAHAASGYSALIVNVEPSSVHLQPGESTLIRVNVKNIGDTTWQRDGRGWISLYTYEPRYHVSPLRGPTWWSDHQTGELVEASVAPGNTGTVEFFVYTPVGFEGEVSETFKMASEDIAWVDGGQFNVSMIVGDTDAPIVEAAPAKVIESAVPAEVMSDMVSVDSQGYDALLLLRSAKTITARANEIISFKAGFKNSGSQVWNSYELRPTNFAIASGSPPAYYHQSWPSVTVALANTSTVNPGALEFMDFTFRAPNTMGSHNVKFQLVANGVEVSNGIVEIPVEVTNNAAALINAPIDETKPIIVEGEKIEEPRVRVGIDQVEGEVIFVADQDVRVEEADAQLLRMTVPAGQAMRVAYNGSQYVFESGGEILMADSYLRFEGVKGEDTVFTVSSFRDVRSWNTDYNDNTFRDTLEIRYNSKKDRTWLINELPIEPYLYGLDETSGNAPEEYLKALVTAARTYAMYAWEHKTKYAGEFIDMRSTTYDQVYHGHGAEVRRPTVIKAVDDTKGITIQYEGDTIVAAYYSRSNGRTRDWADVWGKDVPYAVSVEVPCEAGNTEWGHGVGMSAGGALCFAEEGKTFDEILKYFYTGVDLVKRW